MWIRTDALTLRCAETGAMVHYEPTDRNGPSFLQISYGPSVAPIRLEGNPARQLWEYLSGTVWDAAETAPSPPPPGPGGEDRRP